MATVNKPAERTLETEILGRTIKFDYSETWVGYSVLSLRVVMGWVFLQAGLEKLLTPGGWSAAGYLNNAIAPANPFQGLFTAMAGIPFVDPLVIWGQLLIGVALLLGALVRFAAFCGALMMLLFWMSHIQGGLLAGLPVEHGWVVDSTLVYAAVVFGLGAVGAGRILGLDAKLEALPVVRNNPWLRYLLG